MRDTFLGLNQKRVLELKEKYIDKKGESLIKTEDLILIRRIQDFINSSNSISVMIDNEVYSWVHYETIQEDLPMIFPSLKSLKKRIEKLKELNLIINKKYAVTKTMCENDKKFKNAGNYSMVNLSSECRKIFDFTNVSEPCTHEGVKGYTHEGVKGYTHEGVNKEYLEINTMKRKPLIDRCDEKSNKTEYAEQVTSNEVINQSLDTDKVKFRENLKKYMNMVSTVTGKNIMEISNVINPQSMKDYDLNLLIEEIENSDFLSGKLERKPMITNFTRKTMIDRILIGEYRNKVEKKEVKKISVVGIV